MAAGNKLPKEIRGNYELEVLYLAELRHQQEEMNYQTSQASCTLWQVQGNLKWEILCIGNRMEYTKKTRPRDY